MKEAYFTPGALAGKAQDMLSECLGVRRREGLNLSPNLAALLVLDMQNYFFQETSHAFIPSAPAIIPGVAGLVGAFTQAGRPVFFTRHSNTPQDACQMQTWWRALIASGSDASQLIPQMDRTQGSVLDKSQYDAFLHTGLETRLKAQGASQVVVCGVMTHLCCESTARSAFMHGFEVFFTIDGTATYNERFHRASLTNLAHGFAVPLLVEEVAAVMGGRDVH